MRDSEKTPSWRYFIQAGLWVSAGTLLGRLSGFAREAAIAGELGKSFEADLSVLLLTLPDVVVGLLTGGALGTVLVPEFARIGKGGARIALAQAGKWVAACFGIISLFAAIRPDWLLSFLAPGFSSEMITDAGLPVRISLISIPITALCGVLAAYLHFHQKFGAPAMQAPVYNLLIIVAVLSLPMESVPRGIAWAVSLGALLRLSVLCVALPGQAKGEVENEKTEAGELDRGILRRFLQAMAAGTFPLMIPVVARQFASLEPAGSIALLSYSFKLLELPVSLVHGGLAIVVFPKLAELFSKPESRLEGNRLAKASLSVVLVFGALAAMAVGFLAYEGWTHPVAWKDLSKESFAEVSWLVLAGAVSIPAYASIWITSAIFGARRDTRTPLLLNGVSLATFVPLAMALRNSFGLSGVIYAYVITQYLAMGLHFAALGRQVTRPC